MPGGGAGDALQGVVVLLGHQDPKSQKTMCIVSSAGVFVPGREAGDALQSAVVLPAVRGDAARTHARAFAGRRARQPAGSRRAAAPHRWVVVFKNEPLGLPINLERRFQEPQQGPRLHHALQCTPSLDAVHCSLLALRKLLLHTGSFLKGQSRTGKQF